MLGLGVWLWMWMCCGLKVEGAGLVVLRCV